MKTGYLPWIYVNYYTFLSAVGRLFGNDLEIEYRNSKIFVKGSKKLILFNLTRHLRIEMVEISLKGKYVKCPFKIRYLMIIVAKSEKRVRLKAIFPKV
ncbi:MAG: hypothetical protein KAT37_04980 [Candidatus Aenigmarchaeota archaeon]|nr:hypothetical protein [Candidatus Aenigmarchaeota archaeon]